MELKVLRQVARLTQQQLADAAGCDASLISHLESGRREITSVAYETIVKMARALNLEPEQLCPIPQDEQAKPRAVNQ